MSPRASWARIVCEAAWVSSRARLAYPQFGLSRLVGAPRLPGSILQGGPCVWTLLSAAQQSALSNQMFRRGVMVVVRGVNEARMRWREHDVRHALAASLAPRLCTQYKRHSGVCENGTVTGRDSVIASSSFTRSAARPVGRAPVLSLASGSHMTVTQN